MGRPRRKGRPHVAHARLSMAREVRPARHAEESLIALAEREILAHLEAFPDSADTLEGIHRWWIRWPGPEPALAVTDAALARLKEKGLLRPVQLGSSLLWRQQRP